MMPRGSADVRGEQLAALETEHHALLTTPEGGAAAGAGRGRRLAARGLAARESARDAPAARSCHRHAAFPDRAPGQGDVRAPRSSGSRRARPTTSRCFAPHLEEVVHLVRDKAALLGPGARPARRTMPWSTRSRPAFRPRISTRSSRPCRASSPASSIRPSKCRPDRAPMPFAGKFTRGPPAPAGARGAQGAGISLRSGPAG